MNLPVSTNDFIFVSFALFIIGAIGVLTRRNPLVMFMSIELMLNAANLAFITFANTLHSVDGWIFTFLVLTVAAAEVVVGLALIVSLFRNREEIDIDHLNTLKG